MSEKNEKQRGNLTEIYQKALTFEQVDNYLKEKVKNSVCPCCNSTDWGVDLTEDDRFVEPGLVSFSWSGLLRTQKYMEIVTTICTVCGYVRLFSGHHIRVWRETLISKENP